MTGLEVTRWAVPWSQDKIKLRNVNPKRQSGMFNAVHALI